MLKIKKLQMGGQMAPPEDPAAAQGAPMGAEPGMEQGADPVMQLVEMAAQALQSQDPNMMAAVCEGLISLVQGGGGEQGAPTPEEPVMMRKGSSLKVLKKGRKMSKKC